MADAAAMHAHEEHTVRRSTVAQAPTPTPQPEPAPQVTATPDAPTPYEAASDAAAPSSDAYPVAPASTGTFAVHPGAVPPPTYAGYPADAGAHYGPYRQVSPTAPSFWAHRIPASVIAAATLQALLAIVVFVHRVIVFGPLVEYGGATALFALALILESVAIAGLLVWLAYRQARADQAAAWAGALFCGALALQTLLELVLPEDYVIVPGSTIIIKVLIVAAGAAIAGLLLIPPSADFYYLRDSKPSGVRLAQIICVVIGVLCCLLALMMLPLLGTGSGAVIAVLLISALCALLLLSLAPGIAAGEKTARNGCTLALVVFFIGSWVSTNSVLGAGISGMIVPATLASAALGGLWGSHARGHFLG